MNYSETYFELDSEEATHSHPLSPIVTLSVVCTLKGMSRKSIQKIKAMLLCIEYGILFTKIKAYNALNAMFVNTVDTGVCGLSRKSSIPDERFQQCLKIFYSNHLVSTMPTCISLSSMVHCEYRMNLVSTVSTG